MMKFLVTCSLVSFSVAASAADRPEIIRQGNVREAGRCPIAYPDATKGEWRPESLLLGTMIAALAGQAVKAGVNAAGTAIEEASKEKGFVTEAARGFYFYQIAKPDDSHKTAWAKVRPGCLILSYTKQDAAATLDGLEKEPALLALQEHHASDGKTPRLFSDRDRVEAELSAIGITRMPSLYAEIAVIPVAEGLVLRPVLVWYRDAQAGVGKGRLDAELQATLAIPGSTGDVGATFATARMPLPKIAPGEALDFDQLVDSSSVIIPRRTTDGTTATALASINSLLTAQLTKNAEAKAAAAALNRAKPTERRKAAVAKKIADDAKATADKAVRDISYEEVASLGATNIKARFVLVKDASKFGLAIATALKGSADSISAAVSKELTPGAAWRAEDTAYVTARATIGAKQRAYAEAVEAGDASKVAAAEDELTVARAKLNEAAAAMNLPLPYPELMQ